MKTPWQNGWGRGEMDKSGIKGMGAVEGFVINTA